jgi:CyaY protein
VTITEAEYEALAEPELERLLDAIDEIDTDDLTAELESGILTLEFADGTRYVINSHRAARQIWMAAERSAWHFDWNTERKAWVAAKSDEELWSTLKSSIEEKLARSVELTRS